MRFKVGDRVRVSKSVVPDYRDIEGVVVAVQESSDGIFNQYTIETDLGERMPFLEYQLEPT